MPNHNGVLNHKHHRCNRQESQQQHKNHQKNNNNEDVKLYDESSYLKLDKYDDGEDNTCNETYDLIDSNNINDDDENNNLILFNKNKMKMNEIPSLTNQSTSPLRILICTESFHPYTSGIARRFKEIIERLAKRGFLIHIVTGCKGSNTWTSDLELKNKVTFSILKAIEFKDKIDCALPFLLPQVGLF